MRLGNTDEGPAEDPECGRPLDLSALRADDALLDALGAGLVRPDEPYPGCAESDRELVAMLAAWVAQARPDEAEPLPELDPLQMPAPAVRRARPRLAAVPAPTPEPALPAVPAAVSDRRRGLLAVFGRRLAAAALLIGLASSGLAAGVASSDPGGSAPAVSRVSFAERARSIAAAAQVTDELASARTALEEGRREDAARLIASSGDQLPAVRDDDGRARLDRDHRRLSRVLAASGGPPAAGELVLAGRAATVEPSDFLGHLADNNDVLAGDPPAASGSGETNVLAAGGGATTSSGQPTTPADNPAAAGAPTTSDERPTDDQPTSGEGSGPTENPASETPPGSASDSPSESTSEATSDESSPAAESTTAEEPTPAGEPTTTERQPSTTTEAATTPEGPSSSATSSSETSRREEPSSSTREPVAAQTGSGTSPATKSDEPETTARNTETKKAPETTASHPKSTSPRSRDFIGPVQGRSTDRFTATTTTRSSRITSTGRSSPRDQTTTRTSRTSTETDSTDDNQDN